MFLLSVSLGTAYIYLSMNIKQHFAKELQDEGKKIKAVFVLFSLSYMSRAVVYLLSEFEVINHRAAVSYIMYFFWDVIPLSSIMIYHLKAFRAEEKESKKPVTDWTRQSTSSRTPATDSEAQSESETSEAQGVPEFKLSASFSSLLNGCDGDEC